MMTMNCLILHSHHSPEQINSFQNVNPWPVSCNNPLLNADLHAHGQRSRPENKAETPVRAWAEALRAADTARLNLPSPTPVRGPHERKRGRTRAAGRTKGKEREKGFAGAAVWPAGDRQDRRQGQRQDQRAGLRPTSPRGDRPARAPRSRRGWRGAALGSGSQGRRSARTWSPGGPAAAAPQPEVDASRARSKETGRSETGLSGPVRQDWRPHVSLKVPRPEVLPSNERRRTLPLPLLRAAQQPHRPLCGELTEQLRFWLTRQLLANGARTTRTRRLEESSVRGRARREGRSLPGSPRPCAPRGPSACAASRQRARETEERPQPPEAAQTQRSERSLPRRRPDEKTKPGLAAAEQPRSEGQRSWGGAGWHLRSSHGPQRPHGAGGEKRPTEHDALVNAATFRGHSWSTTGQRRGQTRGSADPHEVLKFWVSPWPYRGAIAPSWLPASPLRPQPQEQTTRCKTDRQQREITSSLLTSWRRLQNNTDGIKKSRWRISQSVGIYFFNWKFRNEK